MKLLIVEDEAKTASFLKRGFSEAGFLVHVASDGFEAKHEPAADQPGLDAHQQRGLQR